MVVQSWAWRGGRTWLGHVLPGCLCAVALVALSGAVYSLTEGGPAGRVRPFLFLLAMAGVSGWLVWKVCRTVWMVSRTTENGLVLSASARQWSLGPGEVREVKGDAYGLFLVIVTAADKRVWVWAQIGDRTELLAAIRRSSPSVMIDRYAER